MIKYHLAENHLTDRTDDYMAQVQSTGSFDKEAIVERMLQRGSLLTKTDILAVLNGFDETVQEVIKEGATIALPLFHTGFSISGVFDGPTDSFDSTRHSIKVNISRGTLLREVQGEVKAEKTATPAPSNTIIEVKDSVTGSVNETLSAGGVAEIYGNNIKIAGDNAQNGIFLIAEDGTTTKIATVVQNNPSSLIIMIPSVSAGTYTLSVVTQYAGSNKDLKDSRTVIFNRSLRVDS